MSDLDLGSCLNCQAAVYPEIGSQCTRCGWIPPCPQDPRCVPLAKRPCCKES